MFAIGIAAALGAGALVWAFHERFPRDQFLFLYMPIIGAVAYFGGRGPGFAAAFISLVTADYFIVPPAYSFAIDPAVLPLVVAFAAAAAVVAESAARLRVAETAAYQLALIVQSAEDAIFSKSPDGIIQTWNPGAERLYGYTAAEAMGRPVTILVPPDRPNEFPQLMARLRRGERIDHFDTVRMRKDGRRIDVSVSFSPVGDGGGRIIGASVIARDITGRTHAEARLREQADLMNLTYDALVVWELDGGIRYWNRGAEELYGFSRVEAIGRVLHELLRTLPPEGLKAYTNALDATGRWDGELRHSTRDGREIIVDSRARLINGGGQRLILETNRDISVRKKSEQRQQALTAVTTALSSAVTPEQVAEVVIAHAVQSLGGAAAGLSLLAKDGDSLALIGATGYPDEVTRRWKRYSPQQYGDVADALRTGQVVWNTAPEHLPVTSPERRRGVRAVVPLILDNHAVGVLFLSFGEPRSFDHDDLAFMLTLGRQCAQAVERARLYAREHQIAATLQHALLPPLPQISGIRIDAVYRAATPESDVGGDWYDVFRLPEGRVALTVGDVAGHGLNAAVQMGEMRHAIRTAVLAGHDPANVLRVADAVLQAGGGGMATAVVAVVDPLKLEFTYAAAGHPPPILATRGGVGTLERGTIPLGFGESLPVAPEPQPLPSDALLVLYTDGLIEIDRDLTGGEAMLQAAVAEEYGQRFAEPAHAILDRLTAGRLVLDDIVILTVAVEPGLER